ncbi:hypothetical protein [Candidatus Solincola tengchongensis]|uniref:hypothetical protein n=1 Tax=Candidatus Solincola tengchongensis TaxID=2900693 RepID=UPI00257F2C8C|nr:hypothetical protein [Candidatus Solincola tengchongensis]
MKEEEVRRELKEHLPNFFSSDEALEIALRDEDFRLLYRRKAKWDDELADKALGIYLLSFPALERAERKTGEKLFLNPEGVWYRAEGYELDVKAQRIQPVKGARITAYSLNGIDLDELLERVLGIFVTPRHGFTLEVPLDPRRPWQARIAERLLSFARDYGLLGIPFRPVVGYRLKSRPVRADEGFTYHLPLLPLRLREVILYDTRKGPHVPAEEYFQGYYPTLTFRYPEVPYPHGIFSTYSEPLSDWVTTAYNLLIKLNHMRGIQEGTEDARLIPDLAKELRFVDLGVEFKEGGFRPYFTAHTLYDAIQYALYYKLVGGANIYRCRKCGNPFLKSGKPGSFCSKRCADAYYQAESRRRNPRQRRSPGKAGGGRRPRK